MSAIHDNIIKSYTVDLENDTISLNTVYYNGDVREETSIEFYHVMGHLFSNVLKNSILLDVYNHGMDHFIRDNKAALAKGENYGWPVNHKGHDDLINILKQNNQKYYVVRTSYGMDGWVLAEKMKINTEVKRD
ncbi:MAG: hypothetical protein LBK12_08940 [Odoribacteraceae bacterium]|jgi:hypothetical protein|nr:hypothetical protein [Odoribacteraceae bacterium]